MNPCQRNNEEFSRPVDVRGQWVAVAETPSRILAEFAVNGLRAYDIPAVLDRRPGVLGASGLEMRSLRSGIILAFRIMVPSELAEEASDLVKIFLGGSEAETQPFMED